MKKIIFIFLMLSLVFFYKAGYFENTINKFYENVQYLQKDDVDKDENNDKISEDIYNFANIKIGDTKESVIDKLGEANRIDKSEYNFKWYVYNEYKENFFMIGIEDEKVVSLFTNNINSCENENIDINKDLYYVRENFDTLKYKTKGNIRYEISSNDEYDVICTNNKYITIFYDKFDNYKIWAYEIIDKNSEDEVLSIYPKENISIEDSLMLQIIDLSNSIRYKHNLNPLSYDEKATICAKKHSEDMKNNNYFDHKNLNNETPFDRMEKEGISYTTAGENIAAGQKNAIHVTNGWMNSQGHRKNILGNYKYIGVGVVFGGNYKTYYTQDFFA